MKCTDLLNSCDLSDFLNQEEKNLIINNSTVAKYKKGEILIKQGERVTDAFFICSGYVKVFLEFKRRNLILNIWGPNKFILLGQMISSDQQPFNVTAIEETTVSLIDIAVLREFAQKDSRLALHLFKIFNDSITYYINHNLVSLTQNNIHGRLANIILYLAEVVFKSTSFDMLLSRKELSELCNISRENVIKVLYEFNSDGIIQLNGKSINIMSLENLRRIANHG
ncbi:MAG TPA: Crp/Fnr family transcriptional regulator [Bacteroidales bacterium]|nr:Crp/Fnr family transcriptional regulator [Bacteroidales bacterium]